MTIARIQYWTDEAIVWTDLTTSITVSRYIIWSVYDGAIKVNVAKDPSGGTRHVSATTTS